MSNVDHVNKIRVTPQIKLCRRLELYRTGTVSVLRTPISITDS